MEILTPRELRDLVERVFQPGPDERVLAVMVDLPDSPDQDTQGWKSRREMAAAWVEALGCDLAGNQDSPAELLPHLETGLVCYRNVRLNNADLPGRAWVIPRGTPLPSSCCDLHPDSAVPFEEVFCRYRLILAPTRYSATAPLKNAARKFRFRAATMGGFVPAMIPALRIDYLEVNRRVEFLKGLLDQAEDARLEFRVAGAGETELLQLDLRHRTAHASGGLLREPGTAGNLPSGEAYIVPYEGELPGDPSRSHGRLPVEFVEGVVWYEIRENRAVSVAGANPAAEREAELLAREPAYGNLAELGLGVIRDFGILPCGSILLDEKLGLHLAFGRSDHFGGQVGPGDFSNPEAVVHIDRVYIPETQPAVTVVAVDLQMPGGGRMKLMRNGEYVISFPRG